MSRTAALRKQHDAIAMLAGEISDAAESLSGLFPAQRLHQLLGEFDTILTAHLVAEDRLLYPEMAAADDHRTASTASRFCQEMGGLTDSYAQFAARWTSAERLQAEPAAFRRDWADLSGALAFRIQRENAELYPLADAMSGCDQIEAG